MQYPYYYRRRRRGNYSFYRRAYPRSYTYSSRSQRRAIGNYRAAQQQKDSTDVNLSIPSTCSVFNKDIQIPTKNGGFRTVNAGTYALNVWDLLRNSEFYQSYSNMYDQVKINRIRIKLTPKSYTISSDNSYKAFTICTAWDRTGLSAEQLTLVNTQYITQQDGNDTAVIIGNPGNSDGIYVTTTAEDVATYSSAINKSLNPNTNTSIVRTIYPSSLAEKSTFVNTADLDNWYSGFSKGRYYGIRNPKAVLGGSVSSNGNNFAVYPLEVISSNLRDTNPSYLLESPSFPFKPVLLIATMDKTINSDDDEDQDLSISFNIEADVGVTFRGLRKARIVS